VRNIGEQAGVTPAMINYYFGGKRALYDAVVSDAQDRLRERLAGAYFDFLAEDRELQRILLREVLDQGDGVRELAARYVRPLRAQFEQYFGGGEDGMHLAISLFGAVAGYFLYEPVLGAFLGADPLSPIALARRRHHVIRLATLFEEIPR
jgi:AcrR family transcriptional regulator